MANFPEGLTSEEIRCLNRHKIPVSQLFDLAGRSANDPSVIRAMEQTDTYFGYNGNSCTAGEGHRLVARYGHCMQCEHSGPRTIGELKNRMGSGDVYVAGSLMRKCIKIGSSRDSLARIKALNAQLYGEASDWRRLTYITNTKRHADIEHKIQTVLAPYQIAGLSYVKDGAEQLCAELFSCPFYIAQKAFLDNIPKDVKPATLLGSELAKYDFKQ